MRVLITGIDGFTGRYLAATLSDAGHEVIGLSRKAANDAASTTYEGDLGDVAGLTELIASVRPEAVVHLAAISFVAHGDVGEIYRTNLIGTRNLLEAIAKQRSEVKSVILASSANIYGNSRGGKLDETTQPAPANEYAVSKLAMEYMAKLFLDRLPIVIVRPFNYTGVGQAENFLLPKIVSHIRRRAPVIELGNLDVARDFSDVRTVAHYYLRLLECPAAAGGTYNVCSGTPHTLQDMLALVREISGHEFEVQVNSAFVRENDVKVLLGDPSKLVHTVGTVPVVPLRETLRWMLGEAK
jgi:nucleoside-diphosphate-sugar epimerase